MKLRLDIILSVTIAIAWAFEGPAFADDIVRSAIIAHEDAIQNVDITYDETRLLDMDLMDASGVPDTLRSEHLDPHRTETYSSHFRFLDGRACFEDSTSDKTIKNSLDRGYPVIARQLLTVSTDGRTEQLTTQHLLTGKLAMFGGISQLGSFSPDVTIDLALGLRLVDSNKWLTDRDIQQMREIPQGNPDLVVLRNVDAKGHTNEMHFDRKVLYALTYYRCTGISGNFIEITNSDFHLDGTTFFPHMIVRTSNIRDDHGILKHPFQYILHIKKATVGGDTNTPDLYSIQWPGRMELFDARTNDAIEVGPTTRSISDDDVRQQLEDRQKRHLMLERMAQDRIRAITSSNDNDAH